MKKLLKYVAVLATTIALTVPSVQFIVDFANAIVGEGSGDVDEYWEDWT